MLYLYYQRLQNASANDGSLAVRALLAKLLQARDVIPQTVEKTREGRPFLPLTPFLGISFSHTATLAVCALLDKKTALEGQKSIGGAHDDTWRIGVDAEPLFPTLSRDPIAFSRRFFGEHEQAFVSDAPSAERAMIEVFTQKEAYAKFCGDGLAKHLTTTDTLAPDFCKENGVCFLRRELAAHTVALCLPASLADVPITCTESGTS